MPELQIFSDADMADTITSEVARGRELLVVANHYTAVLATRESAESTWTPLGRGDFGLKSGEIAGVSAGRGQLWWHEVVGSPLGCDILSVAPTQVDQAHIDTWLETAESLTTDTGRCSSLKAADMAQLEYLTARRCQFAGCGRDLGTHTATGVANRSSYFAHIIASSPNGPRGDRLLSAVRSADIENFLLLCDECHRRIDREDPDRFTVAVLQQMRQQSIAEVRRLLSSLQYREAVPIVLMGNVATQSPHFIAREAEEAMWTRKLRMKAGHPHTFFEHGWNKYDPHAATYWPSLFESLESELPQLRKLLRTDTGASGSTDLAVFPLHGASVLILAGRLFGEASAVRIFQFRRERPATSEGGRWAFDDVPASPPQKYRLRELHPHTPGADDACLVVSLTFSIGRGRLPSEVVAEDGTFKTGALEVTSSAKLHHDIVSSEDDLDLISQQLGEAVRILQDEWAVKRIHLFVGAPASVGFKLGQKLQARNHAIYRCYESAFGSNSVFLPTIEIDNREVRAFTGTASLKLA
ncbi:SAVED domain-containing protein [Burkholderia cenocepacia]|uniref:SAVED domain-containing protein n=1 Tax=Burkholderia cenocepacia TaxID=95486 RepID=UPI002AC34FF8|nr:SAVED domain-containing protein [Burkholderia cenocepacia]